MYFSFIHCVCVCVLLGWNAGPPRTLGRCLTQSYNLCPVQHVVDGGCLCSGTVLGNEDMAMAELTSLCSQGAIQIETTRGRRKEAQQGLGITWDPELRHTTFSLPPQP